ncbi:MAG: hypothetical protein WAZ98_10095 [Cyclobacteriaceae bacterium]
MKKSVSFLSIALLFVLMYALMPEAKADVPADNHRKDCFLRDGCKHKVDASCFGANCKEEPHFEAL